jgi:hypothetical protein
MNKTFHLLPKFTVLFILLIVCKTNFAQYKISQIIDENKIQIPYPYKYDGFLMNEFTFDIMNKDVKNEFTAFKKQKYKLLFCSSGFDEPVIISIYDKSAPTVKVAENTINADTKTWSLDIEKAGTYSIVYEVFSSDTGVEHKECIVMLISFQ